MKKLALFLTIVFAVFSTLTVESTKACPPGYSGPYVNTVYVKGCPVVVTWCCGCGIITPQGTICGISVEKLEFTNDYCVNWDYALDVNGNTAPVIPWGLVIAAIIDLKQHCFADYTAVPCDPLHPENCTTYIQVLNGWCFTWHPPVHAYPNDIPGYYEKCTTQPDPSEAFCYSEVCVCFDATGHAQLRFAGPSYPFTCGTGCQQLCGE